jgi:ArsR family transcriptional regulator
VVFLNTQEKSKQTLEKKAEILKAIAHPLRLCILAKLSNVKASNVSNLQDCIDAQQSTVSQHLAKLRSFGIVDYERNGTELNYYLVNQDIKKIIKILLEEGIE